jgi:selT/selW/selH-like putative selenoprotein
LAAKIKKAIPDAAVDLIKGSKGVFIVTADGREVWNKKMMGDKFPDEEKLVNELASVKF